MKKDIFTLPDNIYGWAGLITGLAGSIIYVLQLLFGVFGIDNSDRTFVSIIILLMLLFAVSTSVVSNRLDKIDNPIYAVLRIWLFSFVGVIVVIMIFNWSSMMLDTNFQEYTNNRGGLFYGLRQLSYITDADVNSLEAWATGVQTLIRALFLIVPFIIGVWGGLSVLTADSIDEAEGGILALVSAFVVIIIVWMFKLVGVFLG